MPPRQARDSAWPLLCCVGLLPPSKFCDDAHIFLPHFSLTKIRPFLHVPSIKHTASAGMGPLPLPCSRLGAMQREHRPHINRTHIKTKKVVQARSHCPVPTAFPGPISYFFLQIFEPHCQRQPRPAAPRASEGRRLICWAGGFAEELGAGRDRRRWPILLMEANRGDCKCAQWGDSTTDKAPQRACSAGPAEYTE